MASVSSFLPVLKVHYTKFKPVDLAKRNQAFLSRLARHESWTGNGSLPLPTGYSEPAVNSSNFARAQAARNASKFANFNLLSRKKKYASVPFTDELLRASKGDDAAFVEARVYEIDAKISNMATATGREIFRSGTIATVASKAGQVLTVTNANDILSVQNGQLLQTVSAVSGGTPVVLILEVDKVDYEAGTITMTAASDLTGSSTYIVNAYDYGVSITGLNGWIPFVKPTTGDSFMNVDRSVSSLLSGVFFDGSALPVDEALIRGVAKIQTIGNGMLDMIIVSPNTFASLTIALGAKVRYVDSDDNKRFGVQSLKMDTSAGAIEVMSDYNCQDDRAYVLEMKTWKLYSLDAVPEILDLDGRELSRDPNTDPSVDADPSYSIRLAQYCELGCTAIGHNGVIKLS